MQQQIRCGAVAPAHVATALRAPATALAGKEVREVMLELDNQYVEMEEEDGRNLPMMGQGSGT